MDSGDPKIHSDQKHVRIRLWSTQKSGEETGAGSREKCRLLKQHTT